MHVDIHVIQWHCLKTSKVSCHCSKTWAWKRAVTISGRPPTKHRNFFRSSIFKKKHCFSVFTYSEAGRKFINIFWGVQCLLSFERLPVHLISLFTRINEKRSCHLSWLLPPISQIAQTCLQAQQCMVTGVVYDHHAKLSQLMKSLEMYSKRGGKCD